MLAHQLRCPPASLCQATRLPEGEVGPRPQAQPLRPGVVDHRPRILIIEDNHDVADSLQLLLEVLGHETRVAYNGPDGVALAAEWLPEVVLSDIGLPGMDGYGVARALRANPSTAGIRLIAVTGYGNDNDRRRAAEAGFDCHFTKPVDSAVLLAMINRLSPPQ